MLRSFIEYGFVVGFSNGGMMTYRIGAQITTKIRAIAVIAGSIGGKDSDLPFNTIPQPKQPLSVLTMHGLIDNTVIYAGGVNKKKDGNFLSVSESVNFWVKNNKCNKPPAEDSINDGLALRKSYFSCSNSTKVVLYTIPRSGHVWFGGLQEIIKNPFHQSFSATDTIWDFFN